MEVGVERDCTVHRKGGVERDCIVQQDILVSIIFVLLSVTKFCTDIFLYFLYWHIDIDNQSNRGIHFSSVLAIGRKWRKNYTNKKSSCLTVPCIGDDDTDRRLTFRTLLITLLRPISLAQVSLRGLRDSISLCVTLSQHRTNTPRLEW